VSLKAEILANLATDSIDDLRLSKVLEEAEPPSFGHVKRWEAARSWFIENRRETARTEAEALILRLATPVQAAEPRFLPNLMTLWSLRLTCRELSLSAVAVALCELVGMGLDAQIRSEILIFGARQARAPEFGGVVPLLATGLSDALINAKKEGDLARRDVLLEELHGLAKAHPDSSTAQAQLAKALFNMLHYTNDEGDLERLYGLLAKLHVLASEHPADVVVRNLLAKSLFNALHYADALRDVIPFSLSCAPSQRRIPRTRRCAKVL
jgi:hypothetical protein